MFTALLITALTPAADGKEHGRVTSLKRPGRPVFLNGRELLVWDESGAIDAFSLIGKRVRRVRNPDTPPGGRWPPPATKPSN